MKRIFLPSALAAVMFATYFAWTCFTSSQASAQQPIAPAAQGANGIALVDVNYILKKHVRLKAQLKDLGVEAETVQKNFERQLQDLQAQGQTLSQMKPGTPDYTALEEKLVSMKANIQGQIALKRKDFEQKEAHLYFNAYREISDEVTGFCEQRGISLVLNFNGDNAHEENPQEVGRWITRHVIYYSKPMDITPYILQRFAPPQGATRPNEPMGVYPAAR